MKYTAFCHCHSGTGRLAEASGKERNKCIREIEVGEGESLTMKSRELLRELNEGVKDCFWAIHQVVPPQPKSTQ